MKRRIRTILLLLSAAVIFALILFGQAMQLGDWFGLVALALLVIWLWAAYRHWPKVFRMLYGGGSLEEAENEVRDEK